MESGALCVQSVSAEAKNGSLPFSSGSFMERGLPTCPGCLYGGKLILLVFLSRFPVYEKLNPSPQEALQRVPSSFPFFSLSSY